jgi:hypothetical protein
MPQEGSTTTVLQPEPAHPGDKHVLMRRVSSLTLMAIILIACVGIASVVILSRHRRRLLEPGTSRRKRRPPPDPWFESARRIKPNGGPKPDDDDTVDLDPDEIGPADVEGDEGGKR